MSLRKTVAGFLFSVVFLSALMYITVGSDLIYSNMLAGQEKEEFLGSISDSVEDIVTEDIASEPIEILSEEKNEEEKSVEVIVDNCKINARAAISVESNFLSKDVIIFDQFSNKKLPIASLTKLMTAIVVLDNYNLSKEIIVTKEADSQNPLKKDVKFGDKMSIKDFLNIMLIESSNKSAYTLAQLFGEEIFVEMMNRKARAIGLKNTFFEDPTGLSKNNISTVEDLVKLSKYILKNYPEISLISTTKYIDIPGIGEIKSSNKLLGKIPWIVLGKTGYTIEAKGSLLLVIKNPKNNNYSINVILGSDDRFAEMERLINRPSLNCK